MMNNLDKSHWSYPPKTNQLLTFTQFLSAILLIATILAACASKTPPTPTPTPTVKPPLTSPNNRNVETLNAVQAALRELEYGFAPLVMEEETELVVESGPDGDLIRLAYPQQPANPSGWISLDSFAFSYAVRSQLSPSPQVRQIALGEFDIAAPVDQLEDRISHYAVWVRFTDGSEAVVDLTPLATNFAPRHMASSFITDAPTIEEQFSVQRQGVPLNILQPMTVVEQDGNIYYLVAKTLVTPEHYLFSLRIHLTQTATPIRPLQLTRGAMANVEISRAEFEAVRQLMMAAGPEVFRDQPELLTRSGSNDPALSEVLNQHLPLLWHMVTKLIHREPPVDLPTSTPTPTPIPTPTPTPTPTLTPVLITS